MTKSNTVIRKSTTAIKGHETVNPLSPVNPTTTQASIKRKIDQNVAAGESIKRTNIDFGLPFHNHAQPENQIIATIIFKGNAKSETGKSPARN
jgi:hypothetical protein